MAFTLTAEVYPDMPGAVTLHVAGTAGVTSTLYRIDGSLPQQPVRNYSTSGSGLVTVVDCEAPLGRPVSYTLENSSGTLLAASGEVLCDAHPDGWSLIRSVLKPSVMWMWAEPEDEAGVQWPTSTTSFAVVGSDTPIPVGEVRQRYASTLSFLMRSTDEANQLVSILRDGLPILIRHSPCATAQTRDVLCYVRDVSEVRRGRDGWRSVVCDIQSTKFVAGDTLAPPINSAWDFAALTAAHTDFAAMSAGYASFAAMAMNVPVTVSRDEGALL